MEQYVAVDRDCSMVEGDEARPFPPEGAVEELLQRKYGLTVATYEELDSYVDRNYHVLVEEEYENMHIKSVHPHGYVLKIMNSDDSKKALNMDGQIALMKHVTENGICIQKVMKTVDGEYKSLERIDINCTNERRENFGYFMVRLFTFVPGNMIKKADHTPELMHKVGKFVGNFDNTLKTFSHPGFQKFDHVWTLNNVSYLKKVIHVVTDEAKNTLIWEVIEAYKTEIIPVLARLPKGMIHGDTSEVNIIVEENVQDVHPAITILGFGHSFYGYYVWEISVLIMYMMLDSTDLDPMLVGGHLLAGYLTEIPLNETEWDILHVCVACRFAQSLTFGLYSYAKSRDEYALITAKSGWRLLEKFWRTPKEEIYADWKNVIASYKKSSHTLPLITEAILEEILSNVYGLKLKNFDKLDGYEDKNFHVFTEGESNNPNIVNVCQHGYVLKIFCVGQSRKRAYLEAQDKMLLHLNKEGLCVPYPVMTRQGQMQALQKLYWGATPTGYCESFDYFMVKLLTYIPGKCVSELPLTAELFFNVGQYLALVINHLKDFSHTALVKERVYKLDDFGKIRKSLYCIKDGKRRQLVVNLLEVFEKEVLPNFEKFQKGAVHADFHGRNIILINPEGNGSPEFGLIDFGDIFHGSYMYEVANCIAYFIAQYVHCEYIDLDPALVYDKILAGFQSQLGLTELELSLLPRCVVSRIAHINVLTLAIEIKGDTESYISTMLERAEQSWDIIDAMKDQWRL